MILLALQTLLNIHDMLDICTHLLGSLQLGKDLRLGIGQPVR
ncbi:hypothetical protein ACWD3J_48285 [Streptomyces sp. NPDC002755]